MRRPSPRARLVLYLVVLHLLFAAALWPLWKDERAWLLGVEAGVLASVAVGLALVGGALRPLGLVAQSAERLAENDLGTRFRPVGQPEVDALVGVYNRMADTLREERQRTQEQRHLLEQILRVAPAGVLILDFDGRVAQANPAALRLTGLAEGQVAGRPLGEVPSVLAAAAAALAPGRGAVVATAAGRRVRVVRGDFVDRGFRRGFVLLEELTEELRQSERRAYEKLIRTMSHEVNNTVGAAGSLLSSCLAYSAQLRPEDRRDFEQALAVAIARSEQLATFMRGFADVVRLPRPNPAPADLADLVRGVGTLMAAPAREQGVRLEVEAGPPRTVRLDRALIEQALVNVVKNGIEAAGRGGRVALRVLEAGPVLEVEDSGPGLDEEARAQLFTPFFTTRENGQGLGLTLVQEIVHAHGFELSMDAPPGGPTRFRILLAPRGL